ncbi:hypothetical protein NQ176_g4958 [Zarea fungicola]|uniref:Uncharacterized protein n=1 Tax=Zarea fungicola TaxID=93591 RepID=A0ACC1NC57_9HYPO|nr:hypothetical protein NQ176_g4958 [Lecanicillium fungicola]
MPRDSRRESREDSDKRKPDDNRERHRDRDRDRRHQERVGDDTDRRRESDNRHRSVDFAAMPNPTSFTNMPFMAPSSTPPRQPSNAEGKGKQRRRAPSSSSSSSSSASSLLDISRYYPQNRYGGFFGTFFKAPSERVRRASARHTAARPSKRRTSFYFGGNSSSSSVNSDLAYGNGYIPKQRHRRRSSGGSSSFRNSRPTRTRDGDVLNAGAAGQRSDFPWHPG